MFIVAQRIGKMVWEIEDYMPPDELFEWESMLQIEQEERDKAQKGGGGSGGRKRVTKY